jgi:hypothetical protein
MQRKIKNKIYKTKKLVRKIKKIDMPLSKWEAIKQIL